jgi:hypothetical protein
MWNVECRSVDRGGRDERHTTQERRSGTASIAEAKGHCNFVGLVIQIDTTVVRHHHPPLLDLVRLFKAKC